MNSITGDVIADDQEMNILMNLLVVLRNIIKEM